MFKQNKTYNKYFDFDRLRHLFYLIWLRYRRIFYPMLLIYYHEHHLILKEISFVRGCRIHVQPQIYNFASFDVPCVQYNDIAYYPCNENLNKFSLGSKVLSLIFLLMLLLIGVKANGLIAGCNLLYTHRSSSNEQKRER